jgi:hypothetical protein
MTTTAPESAFGWMRRVLEEWGLGSLYDDAVAIFQRNPGDPDMAWLEIRGTQAYKDRFPGMAEMAAKGIGFSEDAYLEYERDLLNWEQEYDLPSNTLRGRISDLLINDVSPSEVKQRLDINRMAALSAPAETRDALERLYGVGVGGLTAYYLDPDRAVGELQKQYQAASIAGVGSRYGFDVSAGQAERYTELGVTDQEAQAGFSDVSSMANLAAGYGEVVSRDEMLAGRLGGDTGAASKTARAARSRQAGFRGGGGAATGQQGVSGLGSASQ